MSYMANVQASAKSLVEHGVINIAGYGAPTNGASGTGVNICGPGSLYFDATNALTYANVGTLAVPSWQLIGTANLGSGTDGLGAMRVARATFNPSANTAQRPVATYGLGVTIPINAVVCGGFVNVITTFSSAGADAGTIALQVQGANDLVTATAISAGGDIWDAGLRAIVPKANTPESTGIKLTAARELSAVVGGQALLTGKLVLFVYFVQSE